MQGDMADKYREFIESVQYKPNIFTIWCKKEYAPVAAFIKDNPHAQLFFSYGTIYNTILDLDEKIKYSLHKATECADDADFENWKPVELPSRNESLATYYTENAIYRLSTLWDLLAQLYNLKEHIGVPTDKIHATGFFKNIYDKRSDEPFLKRIYEYINEKDSPVGSDEFTGDYAFLKEYRNKLSHRNSPNISSFSEFSTELRLPMIYVLFRTIGDYYNVSTFIAELIDEILMNYKALDGSTPQEFTEETNA